MKEDRQIKEAIGQLSLLGEVALAFSQIASTRMKKIRQEVLAARDFQASIHDIFKEVLASYAREAKRLVRRRRVGDIEKITFLSHNGKTVAVFLAANTGLYGDIVKETFDLFAKNVKRSDAEVTVIGKLGRTMFTNAFPGRPHTYFDLPDFGKLRDELAPVIRHIVQYERVNIYFGRYENVIRQEPAEFDISAEVPIETEKIEGGTKYIFEPTLEDILKFFESELFTSLFEHTIYESQLAKSASRMTAMDAASQNIERRIKKVFLQALRAGHSVANRKQQNALTSIFYMETYGR